MKKAMIACFVCALVIGLAACTATSSHSTANMNYYRGKNIPSEFFRVVSHTAAEIT